MDELTGQETSEQILGNESVPGDAVYKLGENEYVPVSQIRDWKKGYLRQSDYTKKTQELKKQQEDLDAQRAGWVEQQQKEAAAWQSYRQFTEMLRDPKRYQEAQKAVDDYIQRTHGAPQHAQPQSFQDEEARRTGQEALRTAQQAADIAADIKLERELNAVTKEFKDDFGIEVSTEDICKAMVQFKNSDVRAVALQVYGGDLKQAMKTLREGQEKVSKAPSKAKVASASGSTRETFSGEQPKPKSIDEAGQMALQVLQRSRATTGQY